MFLLQLRGLLFLSIFFVIDILNVDSKFRLLYNAQNFINQNIILNLSWVIVVRMP
jgi:hypothetical protein